NKHDTEKSIAIFNQKYHNRGSGSSKTPEMINAIKGMINYVGFIKGKENNIFTKLASRFNHTIKLFY
ncbi:hypothetical protein, partial [Listeria booriae]|uniref:hypothetical protein n=1 Tax=Listeria booriae TaxID=1552123 RepID=UPI004067DEC9